MPLLLVQSLWFNGRYGFLLSAVVSFNLVFLGELFHDNLITLEFCGITNLLNN